MCLVPDFGVVMIMPNPSTKAPSRTQTPFGGDFDPLIINGSSVEDDALKQGYFQQLLEMVPFFKKRTTLLALPIFLIGSFRAISFRAVLHTHPHALDRSSQA
jgi:hypothetical protein